MTTRRAIYCAISIILSLAAMTFLWRYVSKDYKWLSIIVIIFIIRMNVSIFTPGKNKVNP